MVWTPLKLKIMEYPLGLAVFKADFQSLKLSEWTGNLLFMRDNITLNFNKMLCLTKLFIVQDSVCSGDSPDWKSALIYQNIFIESVD